MKRLLLFLIPLLVALCFSGCGGSRNQERVDKIILDGKLRVFYPTAWYVEKGTISDGSFQQDILVALGDANSWEPVQEKEYEDASARATEKWYQLGSTTVNGAILLQPYSDVDYIRMDYEEEEYYFVAKENPTQAVIPLLENNQERIILDAVK